MLKIREYSSGADDGVLLTDRAFAGAYTATSHALSMAVRKIANYDIIISGRQAIDAIPPRWVLIAESWESRRSMPKY